MKRSVPIKLIKAVANMFLLSIFVFSTIQSSIAQSKTTPNPPSSNAKSRSFIGYFENDSMSVAIRKAGDHLSGELRTDEKTYPLTGKANGGNLLGEFEVDGVKTTFTAAITESGIDLKIGFQITKLVRRFDKSAYLGTFRATGISIQVQRFGKNFRGVIKRGTQSMTFEASLHGQKLKGRLVFEGKLGDFSATISGDVLSLAIGSESIRLNRSSKRISNSPILANAVYKETLLFESEDVVEGSIEVGPQNLHVAFITNRDGQHRGKIDGVEQSSKHNVVAAILSPNGRRHALLTKNAEHWWVAVDGESSKAYESLGRGAEFFSFDSKHWACSVQIDGRWHINLNGKIGDSFDEIRGITFSRNSKRFSFLGRRGKHWFTVVDGEVSSPHESVVFGRVLFSPDSKRTAYVITRGTKFHVVADGKESKPYDSVSRVIFDHTSNRLGFIIQRNAKHAAVVDGVEGDFYDQIKHIVFSPSGKHYAYGVRRGPRSYMVKDGTLRGEGFTEALTPIFSPDDERLAFIAVDKGEMFVVEGEQSGPKFKHVQNLAYSPNGKRLNYVGKEAESKWFYVVDGHRTNAYGALPSKIEFSPDNRHFSFIAQRDGEHFLSIDGRDSKPIGRPLPGSRPVFDGSTKLHTIVRRGNKFIRMDIQIGD